MNLRTVCTSGGFGLGLVGVMAACATHVDIQKESGATTAGGSASSSTSTMMMPGAGSGGTSSSSSANGATTGSGGSIPGPGKVVTAETDVAQYQSIVTVGVATSVNVVAGPFFVSDVLISEYTARLSTVVGADCSVPQAQHTVVLNIGFDGMQIHGIRLPVLSNQTLCMDGGNTISLTVLGFKPY